MESRLNDFDRQIKEAYEQEVSASESHGWDNVKNKLDQMAPSPVNYFATIGFGLAGAAIAFLAMIYFLPGFGSSEAELVHTEQHSTNALSEDTIAANAAQKGAQTSQEAMGENQPENGYAASELTQTEDPANPLADDRQKDMDAVIKINLEKASTNKKQKNVGGHDLSEKSLRSEEGLANESNTTILNGSVIKGATTSNGKYVHKSCKGMTIQFEAAKDYGDGAKFLWNFGDGFFSNEANPSHTFNKAGTFDVSLSVTSPSTGHISSNVVQASIQVLEAPKASTEVQFQTANELQINNASRGGDKAEFRWNGKLQDSDRSFAIPVKIMEGESMELVVKNLSGCVDTLTQLITVDEVDDHYFARNLNPSQEAKTERQYFVFDESGAQLVYSGDNPQEWMQDAKGSFKVLQVSETSTHLDVKSGKLIIE